MINVITLFNNVDIDFKNFSNIYLHIYKVVYLKANNLYIAFNEE
jgi:hypothetical protein